LLTIVLYVPDKQDVHCKALDPSKPALHIQILASCVDCELTGHIIHELIDVAPSVLEYVLIVQSIQYEIRSACIVDEYLPTGQSIQLEDSTDQVLYLPALQAVHCVLLLAPAKDVLPPGQF
jgi:hypothetical protein